MQRNVSVRLPDRQWQWCRDHLSEMEQEVFLDSLEHLEQVRVPEPLRVGRSREAFVTLELPIGERVRAIFELDRTTEPGTLTLVGWREGSNR